MNRYRAISISILFFLLQIIPAWGMEPLYSSLQADYIVVQKSERTLTLLMDDKVLRKYRIALGQNPVGDKIKQGDMKTPEGLYIIDSRKADSMYHMALHISYPDKTDIFRADQMGVLPGGNIMIHGTGEKFEWMGGLHAVNDWTDGCIAVTNEEIEEIWQLVPDGIPIEIRP